MLKIRKSVRRPNELKEIFKEENPELWDKVQDLSKRLADLQEMVIPVLPLRQQQLPKDAGLLNEVDAQIAFQSYILARSLYAFAGKANLLIDEQSACYAKALYDNRSRDAEDALDELNATLGILEGAPLESLLDDLVSGLYRLSALTCRFESRMDFAVFRTEKVTWTFHDIMGTINNRGLSDAKMLQEAVNAENSSSISMSEMFIDEKEI